MVSVYKLKWIICLDKEHKLFSIFKSPTHLFRVKTLIVICQAARTREAKNHQRTMFCCSTLKSDRQQAIKLHVGCKTGEKETRYEIKRFGFFLVDLKAADTLFSNTSSLSTEKASGAVRKHGIMSQNWLELVWRVQRCLSKNRKLFGFFSTIDDIFFKQYYNMWWYFIFACKTRLA